MTVVLDTGALIALDRNDREVTVLVRRALERGRRMIVPAGVVAQAWRDGARQVRLGRVLDAEGVEIAPLDEPLARTIGVLLGATSTSDVVDASVAILARQHQAPVASSDARDLVRLDAAIRVIRC